MTLCLVPRANLRQCEQMTTRCALAIAATGLLLAACDSGTAGSTTTTAAVVSTTAAPTTVATTIAPTTVAATTTVPAPGELFFVDGALLGITLGTELSFAESALGLTAVPFDPTTFHPTEIACTGTDDAVEIETGGLTFVFETDRRGATPITIMTNWIYVGGPAAGYTGIVAPGDVRVGDPRSDVEAANPGFTDFGDTIDVLAPFELRYGVASGNVDWFGLIACLLEE